MDQKVLVKVINLLLDEIERDSDSVETRVSDIEERLAKMEAVWPAIEEDSKNAV